MSWEDTAHAFQVDEERGLGEHEAKKRQETFGENTLPEEKPPSPAEIFLRQFRSPLILILLVAGIVTLLFREYTDSGVILGTVLLTTLLGYFQERKATKALASLKKILEIKATVWREGKGKEILQKDVVPGDIILLQPGAKVPADGRVLESWNLKISEAALTGEWISSAKRNDALEEQTPLADRDNMVYMGTTIEEGTGKAVATAIAAGTQLGAVNALLQRVQEERTPYQKKLARFSWVIGIAITMVAFLIFLQGILAGGELVHMFEIAVAIAVSAIPEGLPIAMTVVLAIGMQRILKEKGLVRTMPSAETLGSTSVIATDKTLTLTEGRMEVEEIAPLRLADRELALASAVLANEAFIENPDAVFEKWIVRGRPTDKALVQAAMEAGISKIELEKNTPLALRIPFDSASKYVASFHKSEGGLKAYVSGAPESILELSLLSEDEKRQAEQKLRELTERGLRVVSVATKDVPQETLEKNADKQSFQYLKDEIKDLRFIGFIALKDPLRKGVKEAIKTARQAGVKTIIVTGDHLLTARAVARKVGLPASQENIMEGKDLEQMPDEELASRLPQISVFARVEPAHKMRIIEAWQNQNAVIAMTGDGVNDAPALKKADIGLALGSGTEVAKDVSDLILLEDKFSIIPAAIREGRVILENIRKIITYMLSDSFTETILIGVALLIGAPFLPVTALQILWINLVEGSLPAIALAMEKPDQDVMKQKPPKHDLSLLTGEMKIIIFVIGIITDLILLGLFLWLLSATSYEAQHIQTIVFVGLGLGSLLYVFSCKSLRKNIWEYNPFSNLYLLGAVAVGFFLLFAVIYIPPLQSLFHTVPLRPFDWILLFSLALLNVLLIEAVKWYFIQKDRRRVSLEVQR